MKNFLLPTAAAALLCCGCVPGNGPAATEKWIAPGNTATAWFSEESPTGALGIDIDTQTLRVGKTPGGQQVFSFIRLPLQATWYPEEVTDARLFLKIAQGPAPARVQIAALPRLWEVSETTRADAQALLQTAAFTETEVRQEAEGWASFPVTAFIKTWLRGDAPLYGLALAGAEEVCAFVSAGGEEEALFPYLQVTGAVGDRPTGCGQYGYTETPLPGATVEEGGNCLSYALRDTDMILLEDLAVDFDTLNALYTAAGEEAVLEHMAGLVAGYVAAHQGALQITSFRRLQSFDSAIDPQTEYRMALRVGCKTWDGEVDLGGKGMFDYHCQMQLSDGRWAQKFPLDPSAVVPCSGASLPPDKFPWDSGVIWYGKTQDYYTSSGVYFAVAKATETFTRHREAAR